MTKWIGFFPLTASLMACGPETWSVEGFKDPSSGGLTRAAYELGCPEPQLEVADLGEGTIGVAGCGKKAVYKWAYSAGWVNNTGVAESPMAAPAAAKK
ncbi:MAG: hypothetical protein J0I07_15675 [Myxococcales bacterium]|nr:hypothetical protein [Myxococcales bacterium]